MPAALVRFLIATLVMELTPGPNMTWLALLSAQEGRKAGYRAVAGIALGLALLAIASAAGVASLVRAQPAVYEALRWGGVIFLLYLAWETWRGEEAAHVKDDKGRHFWRGVVVNLLNPKAATVFIVLIPSFASVDRDLGELFVMNALYLAIATLAHVLIVTFAGMFHTSVSGSGREIVIRRVFAVVLAGVAGWLAFSTAR